MKVNLKDKLKKLIKKKFNKKKINKQKCNIKKLLKKNINFNINFYKIFYNLKKKNNCDIIKYYNSIGKKKKHIINPNIFLKKNPKFPLNLYNKNDYHQMRIYNDLKNFYNDNLKKNIYIEHYKLIKEFNPDFEYNTFIKNENFFKKNVSNLKNVFNRNNYYVDFNEKIYFEDMGINEIINFLKKNNIRIIIANGNYTESSGGITILHYFCHLLNYVAKFNIAYICPILNKKINKYTDKDLKSLKTKSNYIAPNVTKKILLNKNNIVVYMDSIKGNPLEQKYVCRWILFFESYFSQKKWQKNDLIMWYCDIYRNSDIVQMFNENNKINQDKIKNNQISLSIISNISKILEIYDNKEINKNNITYTIRKRGKSISNGNRKFDIFKENDKICNNCNNKSWPTLCNCGKIVDGIELIHENNGNNTFRFEYPTKISDEIDVFKKSSIFYSYDAFCFSTVIAALCKCLVIVPKLNIFKDINIYNNIPWMQYGISYGNDVLSINNAKKSLVFVKLLLENLFFNINFENIKLFYESIIKHFFIKKLKINIPESISPKKINIMIYTNCQGHHLKNVFNNLDIFKKYFNIIILPNYIELGNKQKHFDYFLKEIDILIYQPIQDNHINNSKNLLKKIPYYVKKISMPYIYCNWLWLFGLEIPNTMKLIKEYSNINSYDINHILKNNEINFNLINRMKESLNLLKEKESDTDIKVHDYIIQNYKEKRLFFTKNHITKPFIINISNQILKLLEINLILEENNIDLGIYNTYQFHPISTYVQNILNLNYYDNDGDDFYINFFNDYKNNISYDELNKKYHLNENLKMF